jgi:hypothetical protein
MRPSLVVVDTLSRCFVRGEENSARDMGLLIDGVDRIGRELGSAVLLVHHTPARDPTRERGSSSLRAACDTMMILVDSPRDGLVLRCEKQKDGDDFENVCLRLHAVDLNDERRSCVVLPSADTPTGSEPSGSAAQALLWIRSRPDGALYTEWFHGSGLKKATFNRVRAQLEKAGLVTKRGERYMASGEAKS